MLFFCVRQLGSRRRAGVPFLVIEDSGTARSSFSANEGDGSHGLFLLIVLSFPATEHPPFLLLLCKISPCSPPRRRSVPPARFPLTWVLFPFFQKTVGIRKTPPLPSFLYLPSTELAPRPYSPQQVERRLTLSIDDHSFLATPPPFFLTFGENANPPPPPPTPPPTPPPPLPRSSA